jgi:uncharacterized membrane protein HdeD (DUF308 family)
MIKFNCNMNNFDRSVRIIVGSCLLMLGPLTDFINTDLLSNIILGILGAIAILSGIFAYCFLYDFTGHNTLKKDQR